jgi:AAHS family 4-hydroxybenzoate transporter-like MFS transporter
MAKAVDVSEIMGKQPFGAFHVRIIALCLFVQFLDGFDQQALAYAAPTLALAWNIKPADLGWVFGFQAFGTGLGSALLGPLADIVGRKKILVLSVAIFGVLSLGTVLLTSVDQLLILRTATGFGLGASLPLTFVIANEFAPMANRARMVAAMACGFAIGGGTGGLLQSVMLPYWQGIFYIGGVVPLVLAVALVVFLPESVRFLAMKGDRQDEVAAILKSVDMELDFPPGTDFSTHTEPRRQGFRPAQLFTEKRASITILLWLTYLVTLTSLNTLNNWLPFALTRVGLFPQIAARITTLFQFGGIAGVLALGWIADRVGYPRVLITAFSFLAIFVAVTGAADGSAVLLSVTVAGMGFCLVGANNTLNAFATTLYPTDIRATGVSWAGSFGRFLSGFGPMVGGFLIANLPIQPVFVIFALPAVCGVFFMLALLQLRRWSLPEKAANVRARIRV